MTVPDVDGISSVMAEVLHYTHRPQAAHKIHAIPCHIRQDWSGEVAQSLRKNPSQFYEVSSSRNRPRRKVDGSF